MTMPPLRSIDEEAAACRAAFAAMPEAKYAVHLHHEEPVESLNEPAENRIRYILEEKPKEERALRLRLFRPVTGPAYAEYQRVRAPAEAEYRRVRAPAYAEYQLVCAPAWAEYQRVRAAAWAEYQRVCDITWAEYERVRAPAWVEYQRVCDTAHAALCVPGCPFDGKSIFGRKE